MSLITSGLQFIAKDNIPVIKECVSPIEFEFPIFDASDKMVTSDSHVPVIPNAIAEPTTKVNSPTTLKKRLEEGFIHAYTKRHEMFGREILRPYYYDVKAYIPKDTVFYIDDKLDSIAAERVFITDHIIDSSLLKYDYTRRFTEMVLFEQVSADKVEEGYLMTGKNTFIHPLNIPEQGNLTYKNVDGVVISTKGDTFIIAAINDAKLPFKPEFDNEKSVSDHMASFHTKHTKVGDWYLPTASEAKALSYNLLKYNAVMRLMRRAVNTDIWVGDPYEIEQPSSAPKFSTYNDRPLIYEPPHWHYDVIPFMRVPKSKINIF